MPTEKQQPDDSNSKLNGETNTKTESKPASLSIRGHDTELTSNQSSFTLTVDLPGVRLSDLKLQVVGEKGVLVITADRTTGESTKKYFHQFPLDEETMDTANIRASFVDGVLEITIPKQDKVKAEPIMVPVKKVNALSEQATEASPSSSEKQELVVMDMPGVKSENVKIEFFERRLHVQAERRKGDTTTKKYHRVFSINTKRIDVTQMEGYLSDGVLTLVAPLKQHLAPQMVPVSTIPTEQPVNNNTSLADEEFVNVEATLPETVSDEEVAEDEAASNRD